MFGNWIVIWYVCYIFDFIVDIWNFNCVRAAAFIFDSGTDVLKSVEYMSIYVYNYEFDYVYNCIYVLAIMPY